ncbi:MAG: hypothetical protein ACLRFH_03505 [Opitutales bacterium]
MLSKITKLIGFGVIIGLSGLCALGNRIDVFYEGGPTLVAEGIDGVELPAELSDPSHDLWDEYDPYVKFVGIRLNLPQELIADCEYKRWAIHDKNRIYELEKVILTEENFHTWCNNQKNFNNIGYFFYKSMSSYAYILKIANEKNYLIPWDFCRKIRLGSILKSIQMKDSIDQNYAPLPKNSTAKYLEIFNSVLL